MIESGLSNRFLEVGKIKIGGKGEKRQSKNKKFFRLPVRYDCFVVTTTEKDDHDNFKRDEQIHKIIGDEPKELSIRLPFDDIDMNFYTSFALYEGRKNRCRGNGIKAERTLKGGEVKKFDCNQDCEFLVSAKCKPSGILSCHISMSYNVGGIYRFRTHSWNTVSAILSALKYFKDNIPGGILQGIPFKLKFLKKATAEHGNVPVVTLVADGQELEKMRALGAHEMSMRKRLGISPGHIENMAKESGYSPQGYDNPNDIQDEFYPEAEIIEPGTSQEDIDDELTEEKPPDTVEKIIDKEDSEPPKKNDGKKQKNLF